MKIKMTTTSTTVEQHLPSFDKLNLPNMRPVIVCAECKYWSRVKGDVGTCWRQDGLGWEASETDFCSRARRKTNGKN